MTIEISVRHELKPLRQALTRMERRALPAATSAALNKAAASVRGAATKRLAAETKIKLSAVRAGITLHKANKLTLAARIEARGRPLNVIRFMTPGQIRTWLNSVRRPRPPVHAKPWGIKRVYRRSVFIGNDGRTLFIREGKSRLSIRPLSGPSIGRELTAKTSSGRAIRAVINRQFRERFPVEMSRALANELRKLGFR